jgi:hypothetical protein
MTKIKQKNGRKTENAEVRKIVNSVLARRTEMKYNITSFGTAGIGVAGVVTPITQNVIQGDQVNQRSGNAIFLHKVDLILSAISGLQCAFRVIIFVDKRNVGTLPIVAEVLDAARPTSPYDIVSTVNNRFTYLYDELIAMNAIAASNSSITRHVTKTFRKKVAFNGTTSVTAANGENAIFLLAICDAAVNPALTWDCGVHYTDM